MKKQSKKKKNKRVFLVFIDSFEVGAYAGLNEFEAIRAYARTEYPDWGDDTVRYLRSEGGVWATEVS